MSKNSPEKYNKPAIEHTNQDTSTDHLSDTTTLINNSILQSLDKIKQENLSEQNFEKIDLSNKTFISCNFTKANLNGLDLSNTTFISCDFTQATLNTSQIGVLIKPILNDTSVENLIFNEKTLILLPESSNDALKQYITPVNYVEPTLETHPEYLDLKQQYLSGKIDRNTFNIRKNDIEFGLKFLLSNTDIEGFKSRKFLALKNPNDLESLTHFQKIFVNSECIELEKTIAFDKNQNEVPYMSIDNTQEFTWSRREFSFPDQTIAILKDLELENENPQPLGQLNPFLDFPL